MTLTAKGAFKWGMCGTFSALFNYHISSNIYSDQAKNLNEMAHKGVNPMHFMYLKIPAWAFAFFLLLN